MERFVFVERHHLLLKFVDDVEYLVVALAILVFRLRVDFRNGVFHELFAGVRELFIAFFFQLLRLVLCVNCDLLLLLLEKLVFLRHDLNNCVYLSLNFFQKLWQRCVVHLKHGLKPEYSVDYLNPRLL